MSSLPFPPEILLLITSSASPSPSRDLQSYQQRQRTLQSLSLVHRSWTRIAQEYLRKEVWVREREDAEMEAKEKGFIRKVVGTECLTLEGDLSYVLDYTSFKMRTQVKYLRILVVKDTSVEEEDSEEEPDIVSANLDAVERFPLLEVLVFAQGLILMGKSDANISLPNLRRLVLQGDLELDDLDAINTPSPIFSPRNTPNLVNIALDQTSLQFWGFDHHFSGIFDQITTLAVRDFGRDGSMSALKFLDKLRNLRHLSLDTIRMTKQALLRSRGLNLQSLHLSSSMVKDKPNLAGFLVNIANGKITEILIERIIIYGPKVASLEGNRDAIEWRENQSRPPFEDFDGR